MSGMQPRLMAVAGPLKGSVFPLPEGEWSAGRLAGNQLYLDDNAVSRRHCTFQRDGPRCTVKDLESHNGTFVNGTPVTEHQLTQGDQIRIGGSMFLFLTGDDGGQGEEP